MPVRMKVIVPKDLVMQPQKLARAVTNGLDAAQKGALADFEVTVLTWQHTVQFVTLAPNAGSRIVGTDDEIYGYVNDGTRAHIIAPKNGKALAFPGGGFRPKTRKGYIGSNKGSKGGAVIVRPIVHHPGTTARKFDVAIAEKWRKQLPIVMQRAIDSEV